MIINNDCLDEMRKMEDNSISCVVTDPPYGLHFMGKDWDSFKYKYNSGWKKPNTKPHIGIATSGVSFNAGAYDDRRNDEFQTFIYQFGIEALRIVKPSGHILMFGAPRRYHRQVCGLEDAGWEIRDCLMWVFGSGFPKSHNKFGIEGYGTALKPAFEPIIMAMKPCEGTFANNAEKWGQAGINIDGCRIGNPKDKRCAGTRSYKAGRLAGGLNGEGELHLAPHDNKGRWPANILFDEEAAKMLDEQSGVSRSPPIGSLGGGSGSRNVFGDFAGKKTENGHGDSGGASRFFYCAKTSSRERNEGLEGMETKEAGFKNDSGRGIQRGDAYTQVTYKNNHPTVKPLKLMRYLITLVMPPKDGVLLDPFAGSGSTIVAAHQLGLKAIGIEKSAEYCEIARRRLENVKIIPKEVDPQLSFLNEETPF